MRQPQPTADPQARRIRGSALGAVLGLLATLLSLTALAPPALAKSPASYLPGDRSLVKKYAAIEGAKLGVSLPRGQASFIKIVESPKALLDPQPQPDGTSLPGLAETDCRDANNQLIGPAASCEITMSKDAHTNGDLRATIAHEVFHAYQAVLSGTVANFYHHGKWLYEGSAAWVESDLVHDDPGARESWTNYLRTPHIPLFSRSYEAIGFFGHLAASGVPLWNLFKGMFIQESSEADYAAAGVSESALESEASAFFREPALGAAWDEHGPNVPDPSEVGFKPIKEDVSNQEELLSLAAYSDGAYDLSLKKMSPSKPVLEIRQTGVHLRLHSTGGGDVNEVNPGDIDLCSDAHGCNCPGQPATDLPLFKKGDLALSDGSSAGHVWLIPRKRCETLLPERSCEKLLPGFELPVAQTLEAATGTKLAIETNDPASGTFSSVCLFPGAKGAEVEKEHEEQVFQGVGAIESSVARYPSIVTAEREFVLPPGPAGSSLTQPAIGDEAEIDTTTSKNADGETEYTSTALVRVRNLIASFTILSTGGSSEADAVSAASLLDSVAEEL